MYRNVNFIAEYNSEILDTQIKLEDFIFNVILK